MTATTIYDVAKRAGVGIGTVSRVLNNSGNVSENTRQKVLDAIKELQFKPNYAARKLPRKSRQRNIGVLTQPFQSYHSFVERLRGVQTALNDEEDDFELILFSVNSLDQFDDQITGIAQNGVVEALVVIDFATTQTQRAHLNTVGIPFIEINHHMQADWPCIATDNVLGGAIAADYLHTLGHQRIAYIGDVFENPYGFTTSEERFAGFSGKLDALDLTIPPEYVHLGPHGFEAAKLLTQELMDQVEKMPTAIFTMSDMQALGCTRALEAAGYTVPDDVSVLGYDNLEISDHVGISTVDQYVELSGKYAIEYLLSIQKDRDAQPDALPEQVIIPRQTTCPVV